MKRYTQIVSLNDLDTTQVKCSTGTKFINFLERTGNEFHITHHTNEVKSSILRYVKTELGIITTRKILRDLAELPLPAVIINYNEGSYTAGQAPSIAWHTAKNGKVTL